MLGSKGIAGMELGQIDTGCLGWAHLDMASTLTKLMEDHLLPRMAERVEAPGIAVDIVPDPIADVVIERQVKPSEGKHSQVMTFQSHTEDSQLQAAVQNCSNRWHVVIVD